MRCWGFIFYLIFFHGVFLLFSIVFFTFFPLCFLSSNVSQVTYIVSTAFRLDHLYSPQPPPTLPAWHQTENYWRWYLESQLSRRTALEEVIICSSSLDIHWCFVWNVFIPNSVYFCNSVFLYSFRSISALAICFLWNVLISDSVYFCSSVLLYMCILYLCICVFVYLFRFNLFRLKCVNPLPRPVPDSACYVLIKSFPLSTWGDCKSGLLPHTSSSVFLYLCAFRYFPIYLRCVFVCICVFSCKSGLTNEHISKSVLPFIYGNMCVWVFAYL